MKRLGYLPDNPDDRDEPLLMGARPPPSEAPWILRDYCGPVLAQACNDCVANAGFMAIRIKHAQQIPDPVLGARIPGYYVARAYLNIEDHDEGSRIRDFFRGVNRYGFTPEKPPYDYDPAKVLMRPGPSYTSRSFDQREEAGAIYKRIGAGRKLGIMTSLSSKHPVVLGTTVTWDMLNYKGGNQVLDVPSADALSGDIAGGHAMCAIGYDRESVHFINSHGRDYGDDGFVRLSWDWVLHEMTRDLWSVQRAPLYSAS